MPVTYQVSPEERIVHLSAEGEAIFEELKAALLALLSDPAYRPGFDFLCDRTLETYVPDPEYVHRCVNFLREWRGEMGDYRWATVSRKPALYGMLRMFSMRAELCGIEVEAFTDAEQARSWLAGRRGQTQATHAGATSAGP